MSKESSENNNKMNDNRLYDAEYKNKSLNGNQEINSITQNNTKSSSQDLNNTNLFRIIKKSQNEQSQPKSDKNEDPQNQSIPFREGNIALILDSYEDIFSDFDPRPFSQKALSDDFLSECRRASRDKQEMGLELRLFVPKNKRVASEEIMIKKRLKNHFQKHYLEKIEELNSVKKHGLLWLILGALALLLSTSIEKYQNFLIDFLFIVSQPAGWFLMWSGLEEIFISSKTKKPEIDFYKKMASAKIIFYAY